MKSEYTSLKFKLYNIVRTLSRMLRIDQLTIRQFHRFYYGAPAWRNTTWLGVTTLKCPLDLWVYQEMIHKHKPDVIIECGTSSGGSALYMASMCDLVGNGQIISVDIAPQPNLPTHQRITYITGSSVAPEIVARVKELVGEKKNIFVILDSDHSKDHVLKELQAYAPLVPVGNYVIVEDTNIGGHPVYKSFGPGPMEALDAYLKENNNFEIDRSKEKFYLTFNPRGYLKRVR